MNISVDIDVDVDMGEGASSAGDREIPSRGSLSCGGHANKAVAAVATLLWQRTPVKHRAATQKLSIQPGMHMNLRSTTYELFHAGRPFSPAVRKTGHSRASPAALPQMFSSMLVSMARDIA